MKGCINFKWSALCQEAASSPQRYCHLAFKLPSFVGVHKHHRIFNTTDESRIYSTGDFCMSHYQRISMQNQQLSKTEISTVAASPRGTSCTEFLQHLLAFAWALSMLLSSPHALFWKSWYPISHCDSPTLQINVVCLLTSEYQIPPKRVTDPQHAGKTWPQNM